MADALGGRIRELRLKRGLTQEALGEKLYMRKSTISEYENGTTDIKCSVLQEIAAALEVSPVYFFLDDDMNPLLREAYGLLSDIRDERLLRAALDHIRITSSVMAN